MTNAGTNFAMTRMDSRTLWSTSLAKSVMRNSFPWQVHSRLELRNSRRRFGVLSQPTCEHTRSRTLRRLAESGNGFHPLSTIVTEFGQSAAALSVIRYPRRTTQSRVEQFTVSAAQTDGHICILSERVRHPARVKSSDDDLSHLDMRIERTCMIQKSRGERFDGRRSHPRAFVQPDKVDGIYAPFFVVGARLIGLLALYWALEYVPAVLRSGIAICGAEAPRVPGFDPLWNWS
jgi:hypothetical protein